MKKGHSHQDALPRQAFWSRVTPIIGIALIVAGFLVLKDSSFFGDEGYHRAQIELFLQHEWRMDTSLTTIPGMHAVIAFFSAVLGEKSMSFMRLLVVLASSVGLLAAFGIARILTPTIPALRMLQVLLLPILFPFFFLLYTDAVALTLVLLGLLCFVRKQYFLSLACLGISVLMRQNNIVWLGCFALAWFLQEHGADIRFIGLRLARGTWNAARKKALRTIAAPAVRWKLLFLFLCADLFVAFIVMNGGIAIGDKGSHPFPAIHLGNIFFALLLYFVFFLPMIIQQMPKMKEVLRTQRWIVPMLVGVFILYMLTFWNSHWYNQGIDSVFLRNRILTFITQTPELKAMGFVTIALALLSLIVTPLEKPWRYLLYPFTVVFLLPSWLIEQRYYFVPFVLFILVRKRQSLGMEVALTCYLAVFTGWIFWVVATRWLFL